MSAEPAKIFSLDEWTDFVQSNPRLKDYEKKALINTFPEKEALDAARVKSMAAKKKAEEAETKAQEACEDVKMLKELYLFKLQDLGVNLSSMKKRV